MRTKVRLFTAAELARMKDDGMRQELVAGEVREAPPPGEDHGRVAMNFAGPLWNHVDAYDLGRVYAAETGFLLARRPDTVRAPDASFVVKSRLTRTPRRPGYFEGAPDLALEVLSPSDRDSDVAEKVAAWLDGGCRMVVVADPLRRTLKIFRSAADVRVLTEADAFDGDDVVPGFRLSVARLFAE